MPVTPFLVSVQADVYSCCRSDLSLFVLPSYYIPPPFTPFIYLIGIAPRPRPGAPHRVLLTFGAAVAEYKC